MKFSIIVENKKTGERYPVLEGNGLGDVIIARRALEEAAPEHMVYKIESKSLRIKEWYKEKHQGDELGDRIDERVTFDGLMDVLKRGESVYAYIGVADSFIREQCFEMLAKLNGTSYEDVYKMWLESKQ